ncbi:hypothetical protein SAMN04487897_101257 [Paenibacillus sp. yr247]|uniref:hypothetical protein n=1 Tax=Paenibacillus sp. yr247 TaxID=1761880 RepID=UPI0008920637|nr:hypothetical protein [Paenibacillus sp. yr247]SDM85274.1 hypothetical protein SAMN04487897_101257 [Paenibacillus sp. yr247]
MISATWSPELSSIIASLKQLDLRERMSVLKNLAVTESWNVSQEEKQAVLKAFSKSEKEPAASPWF